MLERLFVAAALGAVTAAAVAQTSGNQPDWLDQAKIVAQMQGVSVGEAVRRAKLQDKVEKLDQRFSSDPEYAGAWIDQKGQTFRATFAFKGGKGNRSIDDAELSEVSDFASTRYSRKELLQERQRLNDVFAANGVSASFLVNTRDQKVSIYPEDAVKLKVLLESGSVTIAPFVEVNSNRLIRNNHATVEGAGLMTGSGYNEQGVYESYYRCVGGFVVTNGSVRGLATAGHCDRQPGDLKTHRGLAIGPRMPGYSNHQNGVDAAWHSKSGDTYLPRVRTSSTTYYTITELGEVLPTVGAVICIVRKDDSQVCAYPQSQLAYWPNNDGPYTVLDRTLADRGDSGGPWLYAGKAYGIHSGNMQWVPGGPLYDHYTPVKSLPKIGINVVTQP